MIKLLSEDIQNTMRKHYENRAWATLWRIKREYKKTWEQFGFSHEEVKRIKRLKPDYI